MTVPYTLLIIKPMTIGRDQGPEILGKILDNCPVNLRKFREWSICDTTLYALSQDTGPIPATLKYDDEIIHAQAQRKSWICIFTHKDTITDPTDSLTAFCGPLDSSKWLVGQLRKDYGGKHPTDTVVHIAHPERASYEANFLFVDFNEDKL